MKVDELKCKYCGNEMFLYERDYDVKGYYVNYYWLCKKCGASAGVKVARISKRVTVEWLEKTEKDPLNTL